MRDFKSGKSKKGFHNNQTNIVQAAKDGRTFVIVLSMSLSDDIWYLHSSASQYMTDYRT